MNSPTQLRLKHLLAYCQDTGLFTRKVSVGRFKAGSVAGHKHPNGYVYICIDSGRYFAHRLAFLYVSGSFPSDQVDHIDHDRSNNAWANIRRATRSDNSKNRARIKTNTSGLTGVTWDARSERWMVQLHINGKNKFLGYYRCKADAGIKAKQAYLEYGYHENHGKNISGALSNEK